MFFTCLILSIDENQKALYFIIWKPQRDKFIIIKSNKTNKLE